MVPWLLGSFVSSYTRCTSHRDPGRQMGKNEGKACSHADSCSNASSGPAELYGTGLTAEDIWAFSPANGVTSTYSQGCPATLPPSLPHSLGTGLNRTPLAAQATARGFSLVPDSTQRWRYEHNECWWTSTTSTLPGRPRGDQQAGRRYRSRPLVPETKGVGGGDAHPPLPTFLLPCEADPASLLGMALQPLCAQSCMRRPRRVCLLRTPQFPRHQAHLKTMRPGPKASPGHTDPQRDAPARPEKGPLRQRP